MTQRGNTLAKRLQSCRLQCGLSQFELAVSSKVPLNTIQRIEQGVTTDPKASTVVRLAKTLGVSVGQLLGTETMTKRSQPVVRDRRRRNHSTFRKGRRNQ